MTNKVPSSHSCARGALLNRLKVVQLLLQHHPWVGRRCCDGLTALGYAAKRGNTEIADALLKAGADPTITSEAGTALDVARHEGHDATAQVIEMAIRQRAGHGDVHLNR